MFFKNLKKEFKKKKASKKNFRKFVFKICFLIREYFLYKTSFDKNFSFKD